MHRQLNRIATIALSLIASVGLLSACGSDSGGKGQASDSKRQQSNYDRLVSQEPAHSMGYSPTRRTINFWIDTWSKPGKLAYVYLQNANGDLIGYYVLAGPPVSMCTSLTPNYKLKGEGGGDSSSEIVLPAPGMDGVYYSGGECNTYYGEDATTHAYIEYTAGLGINVLLYDQPLPNHPNVQPLGPTKISK